MNPIAHRQDKKNHQGRNLKRFREMFGMKQEALAIALGEEWSQKRISLQEAKETLDSNLLSLLAKILKVPEEAIRNFNEEAAIAYFNTFKEECVHPESFNDERFNFNSLEKWIESLEENKRLYERLAEIEREKIEILRKFQKGSG